MTAQNKSMNSKPQGCKKRLKLKDSYDFHHLLSFEEGITQLNQY